MLIILEISVGILFWLSKCIILQIWYIIDCCSTRSFQRHMPVAGQTCKNYYRETKLLKHSDDTTSIKDWKLMKYSRLISGAGDVIASLRSQVCSLLNGRKKMNFIKFYDRSYIRDVNFIHMCWNGLDICYSQREGSQFWRSY